MITNNCRENYTKNLLKNASSGLEKSQKITKRKKS